MVHTKFSRESVAKRGASNLRKLGNTIVHNAANVLYGRRSRPKFYGSYSAGRAKKSSSRKMVKNSKERARGADVLKKKKTVMARNKGKKVSRKFREKVLKTLASKIYGYYQETYFNYIKSSSNNFNTVYLPTVSSAVGGLSEGINGSIFDPTRVLDAASVLFNSKVSVATKALADVGNFNGKTAVIDVLKQWVVITFKNETQREVTLGIWVCHPRNNKPAFVNTRATDPLQNWFDTLTYDAGGTNAANVLAITPNELHTTPLLVPAWKRNWKHEFTKVVMAPGQTYIHNIAGPTGTYNFTKFHDELIYDFNQKGKTTYVMCTQQFDIINDDLGNAARFGQPVGSLGGVGIETVHHYRLSVPEEAGGLSTAVGTSEPLTQRRPCYASKIWVPGVYGPNNSTVDEENPITAFAPR